jgi:transcriptional regulator with XRE-family HTH domain
VAAETLSDTFPPNLRRLRREANLTQEKLAHRAGFHRNVVGLLERGEMSPTIRTVDKLAQALGVAPLDLLQQPRE